HARMARSSMLRKGRRSSAPSRSRPCAFEEKASRGGSADHPPPLFAYPVEVRNLPRCSHHRWRAIRNSCVRYAKRRSAPAASRMRSGQPCSASARQRAGRPDGWSSPKGRTMTRRAPSGTSSSPIVWTRSRAWPSDAGAAMAVVWREKSCAKAPPSGARIPRAERERCLPSPRSPDAAPWPPDDSLLSGITRACAELGRVIEEKPAEEMLRKAESGYRDLFESVSEALIVVDPRTGTIQDANPRACDLYGVPRERMLGTSVHGLWSDAGVARAAIARGRRFETVLHRENLDTVLEVSASPVQYHGQQAALLLSREVTQR